MQLQTQKKQSVRNDSLNSGCNAQERGAVTHPRKLKTTRWRTRCAKRKSANARSGSRRFVGAAASLAPEPAYAANTDEFSGLHWMRSETANTNDDTHEMKPARNELNGNVPTSRQYSICTAPAIEQGIQLQYCIVRDKHGLSARAAQLARVTDTRAFERQEKKFIAQHCCVCVSYCVNRLIVLSPITRWLDDHSSIF